MKSLLNRFFGRSTPKQSRPTCRFQPRFQALESRLLLAGDGCDPELLPQVRDDAEQVLVATTRNSDSEVGNDSVKRNEGTPQADFQALIDLIMTTAKENTWDVEDRSASTTPIVSTLSLVASQTQPVDEQIVESLEQLRRLHELQITIEVRFISLSDNFFEEIGVDFDFGVDDNANLPEDAVTRPDAVANTVVGVDPSGKLTLDLDEIFGQQESGSPTANVGGFEPSAAEVGFAILSDIEAFFVIQAAQGDPRTNLLQAPKVTLFDGQSASTNDMTSRPFVLSVIPVVQ